MVPFNLGPIPTIKAKSSFFDGANREATPQAESLFSQIGGRILTTAGIVFGGNIYGDDDDQTELSKVSEIIQTKIEEKLEEFEEKALVANERFRDRKEINPEIQALEVEVARLLFPTLGKFAGGLESALEKIWGAVSESFYLRGGINLLGLKYGFEPVLDILDTGFGTGLVEKGLKQGKKVVKQEIVQYLKNAEDSIGAYLEGRVNPVPEEVEATIKNSILVAGVKKIAHFALSVFSFLGKVSYQVATIPYHVACLLKPVKAKEVEVPSPKTPEQNMTDEAIHQLIHQPIQEAIKTLPLGRYLLPIGEKVGNLVESMIATRLQFFRDHLFGAKNKASIEKILNTLENNTMLNSLEKNSIKGLGDNLKQINDLYSRGKDDGLSSKEIENEIISKFSHPGLAILTADEVKALDYKKQFLPQIEIAIIEKTAIQTEIQQKINALDITSLLYNLKLKKLNVEFAKNSDHLKALEAAKEDILNMNGLILEKKLEKIKSENDIKINTLIAEKKLEKIKIESDIENFLRNNEFKVNGLLIQIKMYKESLIEEEKKPVKDTEIIASIKKNISDFHNQFIGSVAKFEIELKRIKIKLACVEKKIISLEKKDGMVLKPQAPYINSLSPQVTALIIESKHKHHLDEIQKLKVKHETTLGALKNKKENPLVNALALFEENASYSKSVKNLKSEMNTFVCELKALKAVEDKMFQAEKAYISDLSELILDTLIFPNGMPFYLNVPVLLPNAAELGISLFNLQGRTAGESVINLTRSVFNKSVTFKMQFARTYLLETISSLLVVGLNLCLDQTHLVEKEIPTNREAMGGFNVSIPGIFGDLDIVKERLEMRQVNKRILFGMIDEVVKTFKDET